MANYCRAVIKSPRGTIPDPDFLSIRDPGYRIPDPTTAAKEEEEIFVFPTIFVATNVILLFFEREKKFFSIQNTKNYSIGTFYPKICH